MYVRSGFGNILTAAQAAALPMPKASLAPASFDFQAPDTGACPEGFELIPLTADELVQDELPKRKCRMIDRTWTKKAVTGGYDQMHYSEAQHVCTRDNPAVALPNGMYICASQRDIPSPSKAELDAAAKKYAEKTAAVAGLGEIGELFTLKNAVFAVLLGVAANYLYFKFISKR